MFKNSKDAISFINEEIRKERDRERETERERDRESGGDWERKRQFNVTKSYVYL